MMRTETTLVDEALPRAHFGSRHDRRVAASPEAVWRAIERYDASREAPLAVRSLFLLRGLRIPAGGLREVLGRTGFRVLAQEPARELVAGTFGRFWAPRERANLERPADLEAFVAFDRPGWAKAVLCFRLEPTGEGSTNLVTETRVWCADERARRRFAAYWTAIRLFSGWIRAELLREIARKAEEGP